MDAPRATHSALTAVCTVLLVVGVLPARGIAQGTPPQEQDEPEPGLWWVSGGLGLGIGDPPFLFQGGLSVNAGRGPLYQAAYNHSMEFNALGGPRSTINAVSVAIGRDVTNTGVRTVVFAGPALLWGNGPPEEDRRAYTSFGLVLNGQIITGWGIGLDLYGNINPVMSTAGARIVFQVGWGNGRRRSE